MRAIVFAIVLIFTVSGCDRNAPTPTSQVTAALYTCPMDCKVGPTKISVAQNTPGTCPVCGMKLVPKSAIKAK